MKTLLSLVMLFIILQDNLIEFTGMNFLSYLDEIIIIFIIGIGIYKVFKNKKISRFSLLILILIFIFSFVGLFSGIINSKFNIKDGIMSCFLTIKFWLLLITILNMDIKEKEKNIIFQSVFFVEKIVILFAIFNILFLNSYKRIFPNSFITYRFHIVSVCSLFNHPGKYGWFMLFCAIARFSKYVENKKNIKNLKISIIDCLFAILSMRTKVILGVFLCLTVYLIFIDSKNYKKIFKNIIISCLCCLIIVGFFSEVLRNTYITYYTDKSAPSVRQELKKASFKIAKEYSPLGVGFGKFGSWYASLNYSEYYFKYGLNKMYGITPENTSYAQDTFWPSILGETGYVGLLLYFIMIYLVFSRLKKYAKLKTINKDIYLFAFLALIQSLVESFGGASFSGPPQYFFLAIIIGSALSVMKNEKIE